MELRPAWKRVAQEIADGSLGVDFDWPDRADLQSKVKAAEETAKDEVWGGYRFAVIYEPSPLPSSAGGGGEGEGDGLKTIDLEAGHSSSAGGAAPESRSSQVQMKTIRLVGAWAPNLGIAWV